MSGSGNAKSGGTLRTGHLVVLLVATHTPLTLFWGAIPQAYAISGVESLPLVLGFAGLVMLGFVLGYSGLGKRVRHQGGLYVQVVHGLGRKVGLGAAAVMVVAYIGLVANMYGYFATVLTGLSQSVTGHALPRWAGVVLCITATSVLSRLPARRLVPVLGLVIAGQLIGIAVCVIGAFQKPAGGVVSYQGLEPGGLLSGTFGVALVFAITAFIGTEVGASYSEELIDPQRSLARASYFSYAITATVLVSGALALSVVAGPENLPQLAAQAGAGLMAVLIPQVVGGTSATFAIQVMLSILVVGILGAAVALQSALKRQLSGLARDGLIPGVTGTDPRVLRVAQPVAAGVLALIGTQLKGNQLPLWLQVGCALGVFGVLMLASVATVVWFLRGEADEAGFFGWEGQVVAAAFSAVTLGVMLIYGLTHVSQVAPGGSSAVGWFVNALIFIPFVAGVAAAYTLRGSAPAVYARIGHSQSMPSWEPAPPASAPRVPAHHGASAPTQPFPAPHPARPTPAAQSARAAQPAAWERPVLPSPTWSEPAPRSRPAAPQAAIPRQRRGRED